MITDLLGYYNTIKDLNVDIVYSGPLWAEGIEGIGGTLRRRMEFDALPMGASQAVFSVFIEQVNNMLMYSAEKQNFNLPHKKRKDISKGVFVLGAKGNDYFVQSGNVIKNESVNLLKSRIDHLNTLDKTELRKYYKECMRSENNNPESKGAGIGLVEIARRATSPISYEFTQIDDEHSFYSMYVTIAQKG